MSVITCFACGRELVENEPYSLTEWTGQNRTSGDPIAYWCSKRCLHLSIPTLSMDNEESA